MASNATLVYVGESKQFVYTDGSYETTGNKVINNASFARVDGGNIMKDDALICSYNYQVENGTMKNLWVNFCDPSEATAILAQINACFAALNTENE